MDKLSNAFSEVVVGLERNAQGSVVPAVVLANEVIGASDKSVLSSIVSDWSDGEGKEQAGKSLLNQACVKLSALLKRNNAKPDDLPSFTWYNEVRQEFVSAYMDYEGLQDFQRNTADQAWKRAYERAGFNSVPKATNAKAVAEAERKAKIKLAKDQAVGRALSEAKQDIQQAIANVTAKGDYATLELLINKAKADDKAKQSKANEALKPQKAELVKKINACFDKATLDKVAKLLG